MSLLDHWHPVMLSSQLKSRPVGVKLCGQELVVFRTSTGEVGCLDDVCPHRRMRLSCGHVARDRLQCLYHGWTFNCHGQGESPGTPKLYAKAPSFEVREANQAIWVRSAGSRRQFPAFEVDGYYNVCNMTHRVKAPLELVVDNFCEIEHTPTTHQFFGYPLERMHEVQVEFVPTETTVRVINRGPKKNFSWPMRVLLGVSDNYEFMDDWTTHFSPVYSVYDHWWRDPDTGRESKVKWRLYIFFTPIDDHETALTTFAFTRSTWPGPNGAVRLFKWLMRKTLDHEIRLDKQILESLADYDVSMEGMKLSRFDKVLGLNRERIERVYRGVEGPRLRLAG